jgi:hypothetical protein
VPTLTSRDLVLFLTVLGDTFEELGALVAAVGPSAAKVHCCSFLGVEGLRWLQWLQLFGTPSHLDSPVS